MWLVCGFGKWVHNLLKEIAWTDGYGLVLLSPLSGRQDAVDWPGGGVYECLNTVVMDVLPAMAQQYRCSLQCHEIAFGGSSLGGICALVAGMRYPTVFGSILVESPSCWIGEEKFLYEVRP